MWDYTEKVREHFLRPRNVGVIKDADAVGDVGNVHCGDTLRLYLTIEDERITDAKFQTYGCASAIASSSALTEMVRGKTLEEALSITNEDIAEFLGGLPPEKMHCSVMGQDALRKAIAAYRGVTVADEEGPDGRIVCHCFEVTEGQIERVVRENGLSTIEQVTNYVKAGGGCKKCHDDIQAIINRVRGVVGEEAPPRRPEKLTNLRKIKLITEIIDREIRPMLARDGGDVELIDVEGNRVIVALLGTCRSCPSASFTLTNAVQRKLREFVSNDLVVEEEKA